MQIKVETLRNKLALLKPAINKKTKTPILNNACVIRGKIGATDLENRVILNLPEAGEESFLIPYGAVTEVLKYVQGYKILTVTSKEKGLKLEWDGGAASYLTPGVHDYPDLSQQDEIIAEGMLNGDKILSAFMAAMPYCATESTRPVLTGVHLYLDNVIQVAGADGFRATFQSINMSYPWKGVIIVPQETVKTLELLWKKLPPRPAQKETLVGNLVGEREFKLSVMEHAVKIEFGEIILYSMRISGTPPDVLLLITGFKEPTKVRLMAPELWYAVRKVEGPARDGSGIVKLQWTDSKMTVFAGSEDKGEVSAEFPVEVGSNPGRIALNIKYILDYVAGKEGIITIGVSEPSAPAVFHYGVLPIVAIMPMAATWGDEPREEPKLEEEKAESVEGETIDAEAVVEPTQDETELVEEETPENEPEAEPVAAAPEPKKKGGRRKKEKTQ